MTATTDILSLIPINLDFETHRMGAGRVAPPIVCAVVGTRDEDAPGGIFTDIWTNEPGSGLMEKVRDLIADKRYLIFGQGFSFDLTCLCAQWPELIPVVYQALTEGRVTDLQIREKLLNLSSHGRVTHLVLPDGSTTDIKYSLTRLVRDHLGLDISEDKEADDRWQLRFQELDGKPLSEYPADAVAYLIGDGTYPVQIWERQEEMVRGDSGPFSMPTQYFWTTVSFVLRMQTVWGWKIDEEYRETLRSQLASMLTPEHVKLLLQSGILRPAVLPRPFKKDPTKFTQGKAETRNMKLLHAHIEEVCKANELPVPMTPPSNKYPLGQVSTEAEFLEEIESLSPILEEYVARQKLTKLVDTYLPQISAPTVHPDYDLPKETFRTSSRASSQYPSCQIQNVPERIRACYIPRPGKVLIGLDYGSIGFVTLAQKLLNLFGKSQLAELIISGVNPHDYLGAILCYKLDENFKAAVDTAGIKDEMSLHSYFCALDTEKISAAAPLRALYHHYRSLAKPTNLGYPGGLGAPTFVKYAKGTYGVDLIKMKGGLAGAIQFARELKAIWLEAFPEMREYFRWITSSCKDPLYPDMFAYSSPFGAYRANTDYCSASNGAGMQTSASEGGCFGLFLVSRACYDHTQESCLYGTRPLAWIHDEQILESDEDEWLHEKAYEAARLMVLGMQQVVTSLPIVVKPLLMRRWSKEARQVLDARGRLQVWQPQLLKTSA